MTPRAPVPHPFLHVDEGTIRHPLTGAALGPTDPDDVPLRAVLGGTPTAELDPADVRRLLDGRWLMDADHDPSAEFRLAIVSLELHSVCNDACWFCPVSVDPREREVMPQELVDRLLDELAAHRDTIDAVFLSNYNEPTLAPGFVGQVAAVRARGLPIALLTNGSGLTPARADAIAAQGPLRYLGVNLSTLDPERAVAERGSRHLPAVLRNLDHLADVPFADEMRLIVLGRGDDDHDRAVAEIEARYAGSRFVVAPHHVDDRAGYFSFPATPVPAPLRRLRGCENLGSRPLEHLHITASGRAVLCCEDYDERHVVGDLRRQSVDEVLAGPALARLRRQAYGLEPAAEDLLCRTCSFARGDV